MADLPPEQNERLRQAMWKAIAERFHTQAALAEAMGLSKPALNAILKESGGASADTAARFAEHVAKRPVDEIIGPRKIPPLQKQPDRNTPFPIDAKTRGAATELLMQPPQKFTQRAIDIGFDCIRMRSAEDAKNPAKVAEAVRAAILGTAATLPMPASPSDAPPGVRRSRRRAQ